MPSVLDRFILLLRTSPSWGRAVLYVSAAVVIALAAFVAGRALVHERDDEQLETATAAQRLASSTALMLEQLLDTTDVALVATADELTRRFANGHIDDRTTTRYLEERVARVAGLASLHAYDEDGDPIALPGSAPPFANIGNRDFFIQARDGKGLGLFTGNVSPSRIEHRWAWPLVRRINDSDGSFEGVLLATFKPEVIRALFDGLHLEEDDSIELRDAAMGLVARECPDPVGTEIRICFDEQNYGLELKTAMDNLTTRVPLQDLKIVSTAIMIQKESGGNLAEVLDKTAHVIRERFRLKRQVMTHTAQGRMTGIVLTLLPLALGFALYAVNPDMVSLLWKREIGVKLLWAAAIMTVIGGLIIKKIVDMDV